jgi:hypothetical protein
MSDFERMGVALWRIFEAEAEILDQAADHRSGSSVGKSILGLISHSDSSARRNQPIHLN